MTNEYEAVWKNDPWPSVFVANFEGHVGPSHRKVGFGDLLRYPDEVGNGLAHGTVIKLPATRGIVGAFRAAAARVEALETLLVDGSDEELAAEASEIAKVRGRAA